MSYAETAPADGLTERLQLYARYLVVVAEQLDALAEARQDRIAELQEERSSLEAQLAQPTDPAPSGLDEALSLGLATLEADSETRRTLQERWSALSAGALRSARKVAVPRISGGVYPQPTDRIARFDRRL